jgi:mono/diheme cytochrome c family protein
MTAIRAHILRIAGVATLTIAGSVLASAPLGAQAQPSSSPTGDYLFRTYCASCHGNSAKGDGPLAESLRKRPADLTEIARRNKGVFPRDQVFRIIDGRQPVKGHGGANMPVWGDVFARSSEVHNEAAITERIEALVRYLEGLQARTAN